MKLYHYKHRNFGDALNRWLWPQLIPSLLDDNGAELLVGIGSILNDLVPRTPIKRVLGPGVGYGNGLPQLDDRWHIYAVRGPLSAQALNLPAEKAITDGAVLLRLLGWPKPLPKLHRVAFMPHYHSLTFWDWPQLCADVGFKFVDPFGRIEDTLNTLQQSELVIAEAMHGAIIADALRVPWVPLKIYKHILAFKWQDWLASVDLTYAPERIVPLFHAASIADRLSRVGAVARVPGRRVAARALATASLPLQPLVRRQLKTISTTAPRFLSTDSTIATLTDRLAEQLDRLKEDCAVAT